MPQEDSEQVCISVSEHLILSVAPLGTWMPAQPELFPLRSLLSQFPPTRVLSVPAGKIRVSLEPEERSIALVCCGALIFTPSRAMVAVAFWAITMRSLVGSVAPSAMEMVRLAPSLTVSTPPA